jgi:hypothetical protein
MTKRRRQKEEKMRMLREVAELFMTDWPVTKTDGATHSKSAEVRIDTGNTGNGEGSSRHECSPIGTNGDTKGQEI